MQDTCKLETAKVRKHAGQKYVSEPANFYFDTCQFQAMASETSASEMQIDQDIEGLLGEDILRLTTDEINSRSRLLDNEMQSMRGELNRLKFQSKDLSEKIKENNEKIKLNKQLPYLVGNVVEVFMDLHHIHSLTINYLCVAAHLM